MKAKEVEWTTGMRGRLISGASDDMAHLDGKSFEVLRPLEGGVAVSFANPMLHPAEWHLAESDVEVIV